MAPRSLQSLDPFPLQSVLNSLGKYLLSMEVGHSTGKPMPVLKLLFPNNWLIPEDNRFIVEADYFSEEETLYFIGSEATATLVFADDLITYAADIIKYNDAVEAKKMALAELLREKELLLEQTIREHKEKMESEGVKFRQITPKRPIQPLAPVTLYQDENNTIDKQPDGTLVFRDKSVATVEEILLAPLVPRKPIPAGLDPAIFGEEDYMAEQVREIIPPSVAKRPSANGGLTIINDMPRLNRDEVIRQHHADDY